MNQSDLEHIRASGGVVTETVSHAQELLLQKDGPKVVCLVESPKASDAPLTRDEKDLIKRTMGGRRQQAVLQGILANRGGSVPRDWQELVVNQQIWFER